MINRTISRLLYQSCPYGHQKLRVYRPTADKSACGTCRRRTVKLVFQVVMKRGCMLFHLVTCPSERPSVRERERERERVCVCVCVRVDGNMLCRFRLGCPSIHSSSSQEVQLAQRRVRLQWVGPTARAQLELGKNTTQQERTDPEPRFSEEPNPNPIP